MMDPAGEVNEKGTRGENDGIETLEEGVSLPLDLDPKEEIKADDKTLPYAEENCMIQSRMKNPRTPNRICLSSCRREKSLPSSTTLMEINSWEIEQT